MAWWLFFLIAYSLVMLVVWWRQGPRRAIAAGIFLSLLVPEWVRYYPFGPPPEGFFNTGSLWINLRVAVTVVGVCLYLLHPKATRNWKLMWSDWAMLGLMGTHLVSDTLADGFSWTILLRIYGEWFLPYVAGRIAIQSVGDARWALPFAVGVTLILASFSVAESVLKLDPNPSEMLLVDLSEGLPKPTLRPEDGTPRDAERIGFKRSYGPTMHPIYFATLQLLLLPWMVYAASRSLRVKTVPYWWAGMPLVCLLGIAAPISRAPVLAIGIVVYVMVMILRPQSRYRLGIAGAVVAIVLLLGWDVIIGGLEKFTGEDEHRKVVIIDGKPVKYSGTRHRFLLFEEYSPALWQTGLVGWGTERLVTFPPNVPRASGGVASTTILEETPPPLMNLDLTGKGRRMRPTTPYVPPLPTSVKEAEVATLDNAFLLYTLRFGFLGLFFFAALNVTAAWNYIRLALMPKTEGVVWLAAMAGTIVAMGFVLLTVWMPQDFGYFYLFLVGASAGLLAEKENPQLPAEQPHQSSKRRRRRHRRSSEAPSWPDEPLGEKKLLHEEAAEEPLSEEAPK